MGLLLRIKVHAANIGEREGGKLLLSELQKEHPPIELIWADMGYSGPEFAKRVQTETGAAVEIVKRPRRRFRVKEGIALIERDELPSLMEPMHLPKGSRHREALTDLALELAAQSSGFRRSLPEGVTATLADLVRRLDVPNSSGIWTR